MLLTSLLLLPVISMVIIMFLPSHQGSIIKRIGLASSLITLWISLMLWMYLDESNVLILSANPYYPLVFVSDGLSIFFILLTTFITPIALLSNWSNLEKESLSIKYYTVLIILVEFLLLLVFTVTDLLLFYIFFEAILPPLFMLIGLYGSQRKIKASFYLFLYTFLGSLFMLLSFLGIYWVTGTTNILLLKDLSITIPIQKILWIGIFFAFAIKTPLVPLHLWLPLAHAESPLGGSVLLAGIVLKLSFYGVLRILIPILPEASLYYTPWVYTICVITIIYSSLTTLRQIDLKVIIAYSSVGHMAICILGAFSNNLEGIEGSVLLAIAHGLVSPALFICVGGILYDWTHTRVLNYYRGLVCYMPLFSVIFFLLTLSNIAVPFTANFLGELMILSGSFQRMPILAILCSSSIILSASYAIWLYIWIIYGSYSPYLSVLSDVTRREVYLVVPLLALTILLGVRPDIVLDVLHYPVTRILY